MKLTEFGEDIFFDFFPVTCDSHNKFFLTHMLGLTKSTPECLPQIYTTKPLAEQLKIALNAKGHKCTEKNLIILEPFKPTPLRLSNGEQIEVLAGDSQDINRNLMILLRKDNRTTHLYGGICTDIRSALLNDTFAAWISNGVHTLYMDLNRGITEENYTMQPSNEVIDQLAAMLDHDRTVKIQLIVPLYGTNAFIDQLAKRMRKRVAITGSLVENYAQIIVDSGHLQSNVNIARINVTNLVPFKELMKYSYKNHNKTTIKLTENADSNRDTYFYRELMWSPRPTPFELRLLAEFVQPVRICGILKQQTTVPPYLANLCRGAVKTTNPNQANSAVVRKAKSAPPPKNVIHFKIPQNQKSKNTNLEACAVVAASDSKEIVSSTTSPKEIVSTTTSPKERLKPNINLHEKISPVYHRTKGQLCYLEDSESD